MTSNNVGHRYTGRWDISKWDTISDGELQMLLQYFVRFQSCYLTLSHSAQMEAKEAKPMTTSVDSAFHISNHLEIEDMENQAEAIGMQELFQRKILNANQMHKRSESLNFLKVKMLQTPSATGFRLKFRNLQRLTLQSRTPSNAHRRNLDEADDPYRMTVSFDCRELQECETFVEVRSLGMKLCTTYMYGTSPI